MNNIKPIPSFDLPILGHRVPEPFKHTLGEWCPKSEVRQLEQEHQRAIEALEKLTIYINPITATYRHQKKVTCSDKHLIDLCNYQIEVEKLIEQLKKGE